MMFQNHLILEQEDCANLDICNQQVTCLESNGILEQTAGRSKPRP